MHPGTKAAAQKIRRSFNEVEAGRKSLISSSKFTNQGSYESEEESSSSISEEVQSLNDN